METISSTRSASLSVMLAIYEHMGCVGGFRMEEGELIVKNEIFIRFISTHGQVHRYTVLGLALGDNVALGREYIEDRHQDRGAMGLMTFLGDSAMLVAISIKNAPQQCTGPGDCQPWQCDASSSTSGAQSLCCS